MPRNFTDVDDKINAAAKEAGFPISAVTERYIEAYQSDMAALGVLTPDLEPRVTEHVPEIIGMVERLIARGSCLCGRGACPLSRAPRSRLTGLSPAAIATR